MFQSSTRLLLFLVGVTVALTATRAFTVGPIIFSLSRVSILVFVGWCVLIWAIDRRRLPRDRRHVWLIVFSVGFLISLVVAVAAGSEGFDVVIRGQQVYAPMAFSVLLAFALSDRQRLDAFLSGYLVSIVLTSFSVLAGVGMAEITEAGDRMGGLGGDANRYALEATMGVMIAVLFFYTKPSLFWRIFLTIVVFLALAGIMKSLSRSALVAGVSMFGLWMFRFRRFDMLRYLLPVGVLLGGSLMFVSADWTKRMGTMTSVRKIQADTSIMSRFQGAEYALRGFASNPLLGIGFRRIGPWAQEHSRYLRHSDPGGSAGSALLHSHTAIHNLYLAVLGEMGLVGMIPFSMLLILTWRQYSAAWRLARGVRGDPELSVLYLYAIFLQLAFFGILVAGMFLPELHWKTLWVVVGLSTVVLQLTATRIAQLQAGTVLEESSDFETVTDFGVPDLGGQAPVDPWRGQT